MGIQGNRNQVDNRNQIIINVFGKEDLDHVTSTQIRAILDLSLKSVPGAALPTAASTAVIKTAMMVYSDPQHPENLTCYLPNKKTQEALVHVARGGTTTWEVQPAQLVLPPMAERSINTLFDLQPFEDATEYGPLMKELAANEKRYAAGTELRPILIRNKDLLTRALKALPMSGSGGGYN